MADGPLLQRKADAIRAIFQALPMIPAMKRTLARFSEHATWSIVRPPLVGIDDTIANKLRGDLDATGFAMSGYPATDARQNITA
jgi:4-hydroxy-tetrahydrodipicolinate synthase